MNKKLKITLATLGGFDFVMYLITPLVIISLYIEVFSIKGITRAILIITGLSSAVFRGIKLGGWMKKD